MTERSRRPFVPEAAQVVRVRHVFTGASTSPAAVETADGEAWVMKFSGAGPGPFGLLTELLALGIARAFGAPVPAARPLWLDEGFPWQVGTDEFDAMLQRSWGWNLGIALIPDARPVAAEEVGRFDPAVLGAIAAADALLQNVDRTAKNPNLLEAAGRLWAIDYDACLYLSRALGPPRPAVRTLPPGHLLAGGERDEPAPTIDVAALVATAPGDWIAAAGVGSRRAGGRARALCRHLEVIPVRVAVRVSCRFGSRLAPEWTAASRWQKLRSMCYCGEVPGGRAQQ